MSAPLILASGSTIRRRMLEGVGHRFSVITADIDERALEERLGDVTPAQLAERLAVAKAEAVSRLHRNAIVIGADQVLEHQGHLLHKASSRIEADSKLERLQGSTHRLIAAGALVQDCQTLWVGSDAADLTMRALNAKHRAAYLDKAGDAATASVGAYRLEELGAALFERIEGDYFTILGLPLLHVLAALRAQGIDPFLEDPPT